MHHSPKSLPIKTICWGLHFVSFKEKLHSKIISSDMIEFFRKIRWWRSQVEIRTGRRSNRRRKNWHVRAFVTSWCHTGATSQGHATELRYSWSAGISPCQVMTWCWHDDHCDRHLAQHRDAVQSRCFEPWPDVTENFRNFLVLVGFLQASFDRGLLRWCVLANQSVEVDCEDHVVPPVSWNEIIHKTFFIWDSNRERKRTNADLEDRIRKRRLPNVSPLGFHQWNKIRGEGRRRKLPAYKRLCGEECVKMCERWLGEVRKGWDTGVNNVCVKVWTGNSWVHVCERERGGERGVKEGWGAGGCPAHHPYSKMRSLVMTWIWRSRLSRWCGAWWCPQEHTGVRTLSTHAPPYWSVWPLVCLPCAL